MDGGVSISFDPTKGVKENTTVATKFPAGTTAQRPNAPEAGMVRFNTDEGQFEYHDGTKWKVVSE